MLGHRLRRWPNIDPALGECVAFVVNMPLPPGAAGAMINAVFTPVLYELFQHPEWRSNRVVGISNKLQL